MSHSRSCDIPRMPRVARAALVAHISGVHLGVFPLGRSKLHLFESLLSLLREGRPEVGGRRSLLRLFHDLGGLESLARGNLG
jgi:hypothetical protein